MSTSNPDLVRFDVARGGTETTSYRIEQTTLTSSTIILGCIRRSEHTALYTLIHLLQWARVSPAQVWSRVEQWLQVASSRQGTRA